MTLALFALGEPALSQSSPVKATANRRAGRRTVRAQTDATLVPEAR